MGGAVWSRECLTILAVTFVGIKGALILNVTLKTVFLKVPSPSPAIFLMHTN